MSAAEEPFIRDTTTTYPPSMPCGSLSMYYALHAHVQAGFPTASLRVTR
jgi:hypothetical protein